MNGKLSTTLGVVTGVAIVLLVVAIGSIVMVVNVPRHTDPVIGQPIPQNPGVTSPEVDVPGPVADDAALESSQGTDIAVLADASWIASTAQATGIPDRALAAYAGAAIYVGHMQQCGLGWNTLAGIGYVETHHGTIFDGAIGPDGVASPAIYGVPLDGESTMAIPDSDGGAVDGDDEWDRAVGPMQFIPQTWQIWGQDGNGDGVADPQNIDDAALTAATYLCHEGGSFASSGEWIAAIRAYNNTDDYQLSVANAAQAYLEAAQ
ncbi:lytic transglycosylase domain-containing protein [Gulosibacter sp. 10]|uniref:lytic transglycosylase domain-containing protein n=1 Tax=Gulosibacter sp. 10 TaxID=1255570 RepID=UPI00097F1439|nr:lytic murein transglycosylase [Gulosibacter sp. 10]SJM68105.1 similar to membrane-bound lytic murein transglycosylase B [Gulosibacter sp. 10]